MATNRDGGVKEDMRITHGKNAAQLRRGGRRVETLEIA